VLACLLVVAVPLVGGDVGRLHAAEKDDDDGGGSSDAKQRFAEGNERYARGDYAGAVESFRAAIAADPKLPGPYRNLGLALRALGRWGEALPMYEKYLQLRPDGRHTERVRREIDLCRQKLGMPPLAPSVTAPPATAPAPAQGQIKIAVTLSSRGEGEAAVRVDGILRGSTPITIPATAGNHKLRVEKSGYQTVERDISVKPNELLELTIAMTALPPEESPAVVQPALRESDDRGAIVDEERELARRAKSKKLRRAAWALVGVAAGMGAIGAGFGIAESAAHRDAISVDRETTPRAVVEEQLRDADRLAIGAWVGLSVGGAALVAAIGCFAADPLRGETHAPPRYSVGPTSAMVTW
jgi:F0F1-type ATP synthase membrane subunit c/vacuolar-type H+-ATPase subunit K